MKIWNIKPGRNRAFVKIWRINFLRSRPFVKTCCVKPIEIGYLCKLQLFNNDDNYDELMS